MRKLRSKPIYFLLLFVNILFMFPASANAITVTAGELSGELSDYFVTEWYESYRIKDSLLDSQRNISLSTSVGLGKRAYTNILGRVKGRSSAYASSAGETSTGVANGCYHVEATVNIDRSSATFGIGFPTDKDHGCYQGEFSESAYKTRTYYGNTFFRNVDTHAKGWIMNDAGSAHSEGSF